MHLKKVVFAGFLLPFLGLAGCSESQPAGTKLSGTTYFDVPGFINNQIGQLNRLKASLIKTVWLDQQKSGKEQLTPENWQHELEYFQEIDLNKKALSGAYIVSEQKLPEGKQLIYTLKPEEDAHLRRVEITLNEQEKPVRLRAIQETNNVLFFSREIREFQTNPAGLFRQYQISGVQKIIFFDSLRYATQVNRNQ